MTDVTSSSLINLIRVADKSSISQSSSRGVEGGSDGIDESRNKNNLKIFEIRLDENNTSENDGCLGGEEDETFNDAEEEPFARDNDDDDEEEDDEENDKENNNDRNRLLSIKSISSQQLNSGGGGANFLHIKRISVCGGASGEEDYLSIPNNNTSTTSKTNTSSTTATSSENNNNNNNNSSSIYLNDLKHKLVNSYFTLSRSRSSSVSSTLSTASSSSNSSRSASPTSNDASSLFGSNVKHAKKKHGRKKLKLSANAANNITSAQPVLAPIVANTFPTGTTAASLTTPTQPLPSVTKTSQFSGVAKKVASSFAAAKAASASSTRYNRFTKLRKTLNRGKHEETRLSRKYAAAAAVATTTTTGSTFSIGTACSSIASHHPYHSRQSRKLKCLLVGDAYVGKSTLMCLFLKKIFQTDYQPTIVDDFEVKVNMNGENYTLNLFDTAGQEDWETLRVMAYPESDVIILCFSVVRPDSMENILSKWIVELNLYIPNVLIVLVGTQVDLRDASMVNLEPSDSNYKQRHVSTKEGEDLCKRVKAYRYIECSALTQLNVNEVFNSCIDAYNSGIKKAQPSSCFQILFRTFTNSLRRFRFYSKTKSPTGSTSNTTTSTSGSSSKSGKAKYSKSGSSRKYLHES